MTKNNKTLYIIGNGFDLHHGYMSRYIDFRKYLTANNHSLLYNLETYIGGELWSDFENSLAKVDMYEFFVDNEELLPDEQSDRSGDIHIMEDAAIAAVDSLTKDLTRSLNNWILYIEKKNQDKIELCLSMESNSLYLSFNYSYLLETLYGIARPQICHIHGTAQTIENCGQHEPDELSNIIIGHSIKEQNNTEKKYKTKGLASFSICEAEEILKTQFALSFKNTVHCIDENKQFFNQLFDVNKVIVIGHSLSDIDIPYFNKVAESIKSNASWIISYYDDKELKKIKSQVCSIRPQISHAKVEYRDIYEF